MTESKGKSHLRPAPMILKPRSDSIKHEAYAYIRSALSKVGEMKGNKLPVA